MAERVICVAKPTRKAVDAKPCGVELHRVNLGIPNAPEWGHVAHVRWPHWAVPRKVPA